MEEARRVLERLQRIEELRDAEAEVGRLLGELRALLAEGEAWFAAERAAVEPACPDAAGEAATTLRAGRALTALEDALERGSAVTARSTDSGPEAGRRSGPDGGEVVAEALAV